MERIGERLKQIRKELDINQGEFAKRLEITQGTYSAIENDKEILTPRNLKLICLEFGVSEDWLLNGTGEMFKSKELTPDEKDLLGIYEKLEPEGRKQVRDYAAERLDLQEFRNDQERAFNEGLQGRGLRKRKQAETRISDASQNAPGGATRPPETPQEAKPAPDTEKGESPGIGPSPKNGETG
jgi:transcriptional regulator with XRE-family HTH domain